MQSRFNINPFNELRGCSSGNPDSLLYSIPFQDEHIIYLPLQRLAFIANHSMADYCARFQSDPGTKVQPDFREAHRFLSSAGFFNPPMPIPQSNQDEKAFTPSTAVLLLTTSCNFRCLYCYASAGGKKDTLLSLEAGKKAIDIVCNNARTKNEQRFSLCFHGGGEPTLAREHMRALVEYARGKELQAHISLSTNGYWTAEERDWILSNIDDISLSCDGLKEIHDRQRPSGTGKGTFDVVFDTIRIMDKQKASYGIRLTVTESTVETLPRSIEFLCKETGCGNFQAEPAFNHGRARTGGQSVSSTNRFVDSFLSSYDIARQYGRTLFYSGARPSVITDTFCMAPYNALIINNENKATACYEIFHSTLELAPVFFTGEMSASGRLQIDHDKRRKLLATIRQRRAACRKCFCYWHCAGDCPAKTLTADGKGHLHFGSRCEVNRAITKEILVRFIHEAGGVWHGTVHEPSPFPSLAVIQPSDKRKNRNDD